MRVISYGFGIPALRQPVGQSWYAFGREHSDATGLEWPGGCNASTSADRAVRYNGAPAMQRKIIRCAKSPNPRGGADCTEPIVGAQHRPEQRYMYMATARFPPRPSGFAWTAPLRFGPIALRCVARSSAYAGTSVFPVGDPHICVLRGERSTRRFKQGGRHCRFGRTIAASRSSWSYAFLFL